jgi:N-acetylmuramoyl-L-alanine amidase
MQNHLFGLLACLALVGHGALAQAAQPRSSLAGQVIVVDAGHGGLDNGARVPGLDEKDLVLSISREIAHMLRQAGAKVVESRQADDNLIPRGAKERNFQRKNLEARVELATRSDAGIFLSIHANKYADPSVHGAQVFIGEEPDPERQLLGSCLHAEMSTLSGSRRQLDMISDLYLMRHLKIPAALIEVGFISNTAERSRLMQPAYQHAIAQAVTRGVMCFVRGRSALQLSTHSSRPNPAQAPGATASLA